MKILYASQLSPNDSALYRQWSLERLGHSVVPFNLLDYVPRSPLLHKLEYRAQMGPHVARLNRDLLAIATAEKPDVFWADKLLSLRPATLEQLRAQGIATVSYMIDNAFGPRRDPGWRLYMKCIPLFDLHAVQRDKNIADYTAHGARNVIKIQTAFEPTVNLPPPPGFFPAGSHDSARNRGVSFIGTPYDSRAEFLTQLWHDFDAPVIISGSPVWRKHLAPDVAAALYTGGELFGADYREAIWRSKINLSFITHSNEDEFAHKSFEIAACGGFLLAERSAGHAERFREDEEAVFFTGIEECAAKIRHYLPDEAARERIAAAGHARALRDGYDNDTQVSRILTRLAEIS
jgi:spore maturation protein CgeB